MSQVAEVQEALQAAIDHEPRIFKAGPGEYAEGDKFLGVTVPNTRVIAKRFKTLPLPAIEQLLESEWHDERLCALFVLVAQYAKADTLNKKEQHTITSKRAGQTKRWQSQNCWCKTRTI